MGLFSKTAFQLADEQSSKAIVNAIRTAEQQTSGEIRVFIESKCSMVDPLDRAAEVFYGLKMDLTENKNAVLVYVAIKHHELAIFADEGIYYKMGQSFWENEVQIMIREFKALHYKEGIIKVVADIGKALHAQFPFNRETDKNELPDDIVFGK